MARLSPRFSLKHLIVSETAARRGLDNRPPARVVRRLRRLAAGLERVRAITGRDLDVTSAYRGPALNALVGGSRASHHMQGLAADFSCPRFGSPFRICQAIVRSPLRFDQLIYEHGDADDRGWVHLSFAPKMRRRVLTICKSRGTYQRGLRRCPVDLL
ncbi:MAG TPA: D-Ala-D-Ala carboxypeptidase family metallohydrolase [Burkholderiales bacterium]